MNTSCSYIRQSLLTFFILTSGTSLSALAAEEDCSDAKVKEAMELESGGMDKTALSEEEYKAALGLKNVQVINDLSKAYYVPVPTRLTVYQVSGRVTRFSCK